MNLYSPGETAALLKRHDFFFKKNLGQNFLLDRNTAVKIAGAAKERMPADKKSLAIEIGPGAGALTVQLCQVFGKVLAVELDKHLIPVLEETLAPFDNVSLFNQDALKFDFRNAVRGFPGHAVSVCSNLPYYLTSELIMLLLEQNISLENITVLIQKEAADRLCAKPGSPQYGAITASLSYYAAAEKLFSVSPGNFFPKPKVASSVLRLIPHREAPVKVKKPELLFKLIKASFSERRKTLLNALANAFPNLAKEQLASLLQETGIEPKRRGETLSLGEFALLADAIDNQF